jgi:hypothetical protein
LSTGKNVRGLKLLLALLLLPATGGMTLALMGIGKALLLGGSGLDTPMPLAFGTGYGLWLLVFCLLPKPMRTYVLGHELTHAVWALLMGARVSGLKVGKAGGEVRTSKTNWLIVLAPYFFPFYAMLFIGLFFAGHAIWNWSAHFWVLFFLVGLGWSFHITFTLMVLLTTAQPDVKSQGVLFSAVTIYLMNLLIILITTAALSPQITFADVAGHLWRDNLAAYGWTLDNLRALWQHSLNAIRH